jgi:hypothetical protein
MRVLIAVLFSIAIAACAQSGVKYSYDVKASFSERKSCVEPRGVRVRTKP